MYYHIVEEKNRYGMIISNIVTLIDQITCCEQKGISDQLWMTAPERQTELSSAL